MGGGGKKGGGGGQPPTLQVPAGLFQGAASESGLGQYATGLLNPIASMTNWASSLATGGVAQGIPTFQSQAIQQGPNTLFHGKGKPWSTSFDPSTGLITFTEPQNPAHTFQATAVNAKKQGADIPDSILQQWQNAYVAHQQGATAGGTGSGAGAQLDPYRQQAWTDIQAQQAATGQMPGLQQQAQDFVNLALGTGQKMGALGDYYGTVGQKYSSIGDLEQAQAQQLYGVGMDQLTQAQQQVVAAQARVDPQYQFLVSQENLVQSLETGEGLLPAQKAMIDQARQAEETQLAATLGAAGLGQSTQLAQLRGAADLASAATAGQLQQGNIGVALQGVQAGTQAYTAAQADVAGAESVLGGAQKTIGLAQTQEQVAQGAYGLEQTAYQNQINAYNLQQGAQKLALGGQELLATEQAQLVTELQNISTQSVQLQQTLWNQAMQGYGLLGNIMDSSSKSYGYSLSAYSNMLQAQTAQNQLMAQQQAASQQADASGTSSLFSGLGMLFGSGSGGGGLLGSLGGLFGGAGASAVGGAASAAVGGGAAAAGGAAAGGSGLIAGIGGALTALFCQIAQAIYGFDDPRWEEFREWLLLRGPTWVLRLYGRHADAVSEWIKDKPVVRWIAGTLMQAIARVF